MPGFAELGNSLLTLMKCVHMAVHKASFHCNDTKLSLQRYEAFTATIRSFMYNLEDVFKVSQLMAISRGAGEQQNSPKQASVLMIFIVTFDILVIINIIISTMMIATNIMYQSSFVDSYDESQEKVYRIGQNSQNFYMMNGNGT